MTDHHHAKLRLSWLKSVLLVLVLTTSLILRLVSLDKFVTSDEPAWHWRSLRFYNALTRRDWASTYQASHPGVVTMWIGALSVPITGDTVEFAQRRAHEENGKAVSGFPPLTYAARCTTAIVSWLGIVLVSILVRTLWNGRAALLATILVALDPFYLAHSRLHHTDSLLTTFLTLSVLALLVYQSRGLRFRYLVFSAISAGLAVATKTPGLVIVPWMTLAMLSQLFLPPRSGRARRLSRVLRDGLLWTLILLITVFAIWPALWVDPLGVLRGVFEGSQGEGALSPGHSNFFWFRVRADPGPFFYPVAWLFRTTPWVVCGLGLLLTIGRDECRKRRTAMLWLLAFGCGVMFTVAVKKYDRYLLPAFPILDILAAVGYSAATNRGRWLPRQTWRRVIRVGLLPLLTVAQVAVLWPSIPYYLSYYNPVVGGAAKASDIMLVGWGEGLDQAADYLNHKPDVSGLHVATSSTHEFRPFFVGKTTDSRATPLSLPDYYVIYKNRVQRREEPRILNHFQNQEAEHTVSINGTPYAWVYRNSFYRGETEEIIGRVAAESAGSDSVILMDVDVEPLRAYEGDPELVVVRGPARPDYISTELQRLSAGRRSVWFLTYPETSSDWRGLLLNLLDSHGQAGQEIEAGGVRAVHYSLNERTRFVPRPMEQSSYVLGASVRLIGYDLAQTNLAPGDNIHLCLYWQRSGSIQASYKVFVHLLGPGGQVVGQADSVPQGWARPTHTWRRDEAIPDEYSIGIPGDAPPGHYTLAVGMYREDTMERLPSFDEAGRRVPEDRIDLGSLTISSDGTP